ncbi:MAG: LacI family DNA-binding transcriptional regulator, partial [Cypionkella sp.]
MANRPTIHDVAREAGVSTATVDRVLNAREKVREDTARRVYEAARLVGYHAAPLIGQRVTMELPRLRLGVVLHKERQAFYQSFKTELERAVTNVVGLRASVIIEFASSQTPADFTGLMEDMADRVDAIAATAVTHPDVTDAVTRLNAKGIPCFALLNDFAQGVRQNYLGLNNMKIGRIAAYMIAATCHQPGKIAVFVGGYRWHGHELRETGFRSYFREYAPQFAILDTLVNLETRQLTYEAT